MYRVRTKRTKRLRGHRARRWRCRCVRSTSFCLAPGPRPGLTGRRRRLGIYSEIVVVTRVKLTVANVFSLLAGCIIGWLAGFTVALDFRPDGIFIALAMLVLTTGLWWLMRGKAIWRLGLLGCAAGQALGMMWSFFIIID